VLRAEALRAEWDLAAAQARPFSVAGAWGSASGVVARGAAPARWGFGGRAHAEPAVVVLVAPAFPGLEDAAPAVPLDDALAVGFLRAGCGVARVRSLEHARPGDVEAWVDAVVDAAAAASARSVPGLAGSWMSGAACALAAPRIDGLALLALASCPSAEVMARRTPENEDDPAWTESRTLRLADALAALAPLESACMGDRPVLVASGACDELLPSSHPDAWRAALEANGRPVATEEIAFHDAFMRPHRSSAVEDDGTGLELLARSVASWARAAVSRAGVRRAR
jgi:hypothetical protein